MQTIDINMPWAEIERRQARLSAAEQFRYVDRVPVRPGCGERYWLRQFGRTWAEYTANPRTFLEWQLEAHQWILEHYPGDITGWPLTTRRFSFYGESYGLGCELGHDELTPWIRSHPIQSEADLSRLEAIDATDNRYTHAELAWIAGMEPHLGDYQFRYTDGVIQRLPERLGLGWGSIGVFTLAADLRGPELYLDLYAQPEFAHRFLDIVTDKVIDRYRWLRALGNDAGGGTCLVDDSSGNLSPHLYREFVYPRVMRVLEAIGRPLQIHIDSRADHLLPMYQEMGVQRFVGFGWETSLEKVREYLGGRAYLTGNLSPALLLQGTPEEVYQATRRVIEILGPGGGLVVTDGANMAPGTPLENMRAMVRAAEDYGLPAHRCS
jgi:hypothetical protein